MAYATRDDVFSLGIGAQAFVTRPRAPESYGASDFNPATGVFRLPGNGLALSDLVYLTVTPGGALPGGASALTYYYPLPMGGGDLFQLAATPAGSVLTFTNAGSGWAIVIDQMRRLDKHLADTASIIDEHLTAHEPPILPNPTTGLYPPVLVGLNARMAARRAITSLDIENKQYRLTRDRLDAVEAQDLVLLADWKAGKPVQARPTDQNAVPDNGAIAVGGVPVPWLSGWI